MNININHSDYQLQMQKNQEHELEKHKNREFKSYDLASFDQCPNKIDYWLKEYKIGERILIKLN